MKLENVKAVITVAGSGLGEGTARYLKDRGAKLLLIDLNEDGLKKVAKGLEKASKTHAKQAKIVKKHIKKMKSHAKKR